MIVAGDSMLNENLNVLPLFESVDLSMVEMPMDPLQALLAEGIIGLEARAERTFEKSRPLVNETQFPDQSMHTLDLQLSQLKDKISRLKFYLSDVEDLIPPQV